MKDSESVNRNNGSSGNPEQQGMDNDELESLLKASGKREQAAPEVANMIEQSTHLAWQNAVRAQKKRKRQWLTSSAAAAAILALSLGFIVPKLPFNESLPIAQIINDKGVYTRNQQPNNNSPILLKETL